MTPSIWLILGPIIVIGVITLGVQVVKAVENIRIAKHIGVDPRRETTITTWTDDEKTKDAGS